MEGRSIQEYLYRIKDNIDAVENGQCEQTVMEKIK